MSKSLLSGAGAKGLALCLCLQLFCGGCRENHGNHLSGATSPYLRGQAGDPVDWYEWGEEALARAKKEDKPLLVSIGFSACHWCHVMERESFTDSSVARIMNERFVCIKVDREERPDVDQVYSTACQLITGSAGWPLNAFALPDGKPFFAGTYYSTAGWKNLLLKISDAYRDQRSKVELQARALANGVAEPGLSSGAGADSSAGAGPGPGAGPEPLFRGLYGKMDLSHGGLQGTPKFPNPSMLSFVLQYYFASKDTRALDAAMISLTNMALGGIYDQVGGGFARFATDSSWHIPHFEKMLGDNAALLSVYAHAYQITRDPFIKDILQGIMAFTERDLANGSGGYFSSVDADTKAGEGAYYSWTAEELRKELPDEYGLVADYFQVSAEGNWKDGRNILFADQTPVAFARSRHLDEATLSAKLNAARKRLLSARERREKPLVDKKILTSWNALLICGYLDAYAATGEAGCLRSAVGIGRFLETHAWQADGGLRHVVREERVSSGEAFLEDYAYLAEACLRLYELTFSRHWLDLAKRLADRAISEFHDPVSGMFFFTAGRSDSAVIRQIGIIDNNLPSGNAVMAEVLYKLGHYFDDAHYLDRSANMLARVGVPLSRDGAAFYGRWACLAGLSAHGVNEVAVVGQDALAKGLALQKAYLPFCLFMGSTSSGGSGGAGGSGGGDELPLLRGRSQGDETLIYICTNKVCQRPIADTVAALDQLSRRH